MLVYQTHDSYTHLLLMACMGSTAHRLACAETEMLQAILQALARLQCTVVWSLKAKEQQDLAHLGLKAPKHIHLTEWVEQADLLGHPLLKCFVTQAGTNSISGLPDALLCSESCLK